MEKKPTFAVHVNVYNLGNGFECVIRDLFNSDDFFYGCNAIKVENFGTLKESISFGTSQDGLKFQYQSVSFFQGGRKKDIIKSYEWLKEHVLVNLKDGENAIVIKKENPDKKLIFPYKTQTEKALKLNREAKKIHKEKPQYLWYEIIKCYYNLLSDKNKELVLKEIFSKKPPQTKLISNLSMIFLSDPMGWHYFSTFSKSSFIGIQQLLERNLKSFIFKNIFYIKKELCFLFRETDTKLTKESFILPYDDFVIYLEDPYISNNKSIYMAIVSSNADLFSVSFIGDENGIEYNKSFVLEKDKIVNLEESTRVESVNIPDKILNGLEMSIDDIYDLLNIIFSSMSYITQDKERFDKLKEGKTQLSKSQKKKLKGKKFPGLKDWMTIINPQKDEIDTYDKLKKYKDSKKNLKTFTVRGHWRYQKIGRGWSEIRKIWIKPFIKGEEHLNIEFGRKGYILK